MKAGKYYIETCRGEDAKHRVSNGSGEILSLLVIKFLANEVIIYNL